MCVTSRGRLPSARRPDNGRAMNAPPLTASSRPRRSRPKGAGRAPAARLAPLLPTALLRSRPHLVSDRGSRPPFLSQNHDHNGAIPSRPNAQHSPSAHRVVSKVFDGPLAEDLMRMKGDGLAALHRPNAPPLTALSIHSADGSMKLSHELSPARYAQVSIPPRRLFSSRPFPLALKRSAFQPIRNIPNPPLPTDRHHAPQPRM